MSGHSTTTTALAEETVRKLLLAVWGRQACQNPADWPDVLVRLMRDGTRPDGSFRRGTLKPAVDEAVAALSVAFGAGAPADPAGVVWRAFCRLDRPHCAQLAALLTEASHV